MTALQRVHSGQPERLLTSEPMRTFNVRGRLNEAGLAEAVKANSVGLGTIAVVGLALLYGLTGSFSAAILTGVTLFMVLAVLSSIGGTDHSWSGRHYSGYHVPPRHHPTHIVPIAVPPPVSPGWFSWPSSTSYPPSYPPGGTHATVGGRRIDSRGPPPVYAPPGSTYAPPTRAPGTHAPVGWRKI